MRNKYIRFFVSSTFADMKKERDLLREVLDKLANEYSQQGWQIEAVDLRWGISEEAGLDNKTMQICLSELKHCQELSPKPNFIVLLGNRYGWIPLPETISPEDANLIKYNFNIKKEDKKLFDDWYKLDSNITPNGMYVLQRRTGRFIDKEVWEKEVEYPLSDVFYEIVYGSQIVKRSLLGKFMAKHFPKGMHLASSLLYGLSATELEIQHGALSVDDTKEHVIAYFREISDLYNLSSDIQKEYNETGRYYQDNIEKQSALKHALKEKISKENEFDVNITWNEYQQDSFSAIFKAGMEQRLRHVIEKSVKEAEKEIPETENRKHLGFAELKSKDFVGREVEIETLESYINDLDNRNVIIIQGPSGSGKSTLVAQIVNKYAKTHDIICRFCGTTPFSSFDGDLLKSIEDDFNTLYQGNSQKLPNLLSEIQLSRPLILIVDAINEIDKSKDFLLKFAPYKTEVDEYGNEIKIGTPLSSQLKVIITTTEKHSLKHDKMLILQYVLGSMGKDSMLLVSSILSSHGRRLQPIQYNCLNKIISSSDKSAIYLTVLGYYLLGITSNEDISAIPNNLIDLMRIFVDDLSKPEKHGELVGEALSLLSLERIGLTDHEMLELLRHDEDFYRRFKEKSKQPWDDNSISIPPVLWMRLKYAIRSLLKEKSTEVGMVNTFFHNGIQTAFDEIYLKNEEKRWHFFSLLYDYYKRGETINDHHSIVELIHCGCMASKYATEEERQKIDVEIQNYLQNNSNFISNIIRIAPINFLKDLDVVLESINSPLEKIAYLREIIDVNVNGELFRRALRNLPSNHIYREIFESTEESEFSMKNLLAESYINSIIYTCGKIGKNPLLNVDGTKIAYIHDNGCEIIIKRVSPLFSEISLPFGKEIKEFQADEIFRNFAIITKGTCIIFDSEERKILQKYSIKDNEHVQISAKGNNYIIYDEKEFEAFVDYQPIGVMEYKGWYPKITPSGKYIWCVNKDCVLCRIEIKSGKSITFPVEEEKNEGELVNPLLDSSPNIQACTDNVCVLQYGSNVLFINHFINEKSQEHQCVCLGEKCDAGARVVAVDETEKTIIVESNDMCKKYIVDKDRKIHEMSSTFIGKINAVNNSLSRALVGNKIIDLRKALQKFATERVWNGGINGIAADYSGDHIMVASGINHLCDNQTDLLYISYGNHKRWLPPFLDEFYCYIAGVAISPDGSFAATSSYGKTQLMLYSLEHQNIIKCYSNDIGLPDGETCNDSFIGIKFSSDSQYVAAMIGHHISDGTPQLLCMLNQKGELIRSYPHLGEDWVNHSSIGLTANNRYVYTGTRSCMIKDLIAERDVTKKYGELPCDTMELDRYRGYSLKFIPFVVDNTACCSIITQEKGKMYVLNLDNGSIKTQECNMVLQAASVSGRFLFFVLNGELFMQTYPFNGDFISLYNDVNIVYPALDEDHIYIIQKNNNIVLYNIRTKQAEQKAYNGGVLFSKVCAKGLVCTNNNGRVSVFSPDKKYYVNKPAITTFVRRWNLETKSQENPTAVCPMCGGKIRMNHKIESFLIDNPRERKYEDWDNPDLFGHVCPHCNAELRFNPYIV